MGAYGLNDNKRRDHSMVVKEAMDLTGCSERAVRELLYGHSYDNELHELRQLVEGYPPKVRNRDRSASLEHLLEDLEAQPFYYFDGNSMSTTSATTTPTRPSATPSTTPTSTS